MYAHPDMSVSCSFVGFQLLKNYQIAKYSNLVVDGLLLCGGIVTNKEHYKVFRILFAI